MFSEIGSPIVMGTLILLLTLSLATWSIALYKLWKQLQLRRRDRRFQSEFWSLDEWQDAWRVATVSGGDIAQLAQSGFKELQAVASDHPDLLHRGSPREILERQLRQQLQNIQRYHERGLAELATIGATAPFVGLFGTVWGIMHALKDIGASGAASLDIVAGPIGEALVATAIGIATALPAVLAYNYFLRGLKVRMTDLENFAHDFMRVAARQNFSA
jgi:biopolymer transport protein ExbB